MALALENANNVWQKVNKALGVQTAGTPLTAASAASQNVFKALKTQMATQMQNANLQFVPFSYADLTGATGYQPGIATAFHLYGLWAKKTGTGTTAAWLDVFDANTTTANTLRANVRLTTGTTGAGGEEAALIFPLGIAFATDLTLITATTATGGTAVTGAGDIVNGFAIIGA